ncbi:hypothetical protein [Methanobrevibacter boviskoreani]|uniref:hypothetical protein n=1 Tax=Methanobrevibacter boviskoreani TaxID=1348249 RepID=UPI0023F3A9A2|nr:hypothetical protein [Methanobrevibacter boviskoreani]MDD6255939.1 hypothetical protein [Methanobrevibacter boviskoreani]
MSNGFIVYSPLTTKSVEDFTTNTEENERILLEGIASTTNKDLYGEIISPDAMKKMVEQAPTLNIHGDHRYGLDHVIGAVKDVSESEGKLHIKFLVTKKYSPLIKDMLDTGIHLGLSIGGFVKDYDTTTKTIKNINLKEISLTALPANWDTFGTVRSKNLVKSNCFTGACHNIIKNLKANNMSKEEETNNNIDVNENETENNENTKFITQEDAEKYFNELMAEKEQSITETVLSNVESKINSMVNTAIAEALEQGNKTESDTESDDEIVKSLLTEFNKNMDSKLQEFNNRFFKNLQDNRNPKNHVDKALQNESVEKNENEYSTKSIAEKIVSMN